MTTLNESSNINKAKTIAELDLNSENSREAFNAITELMKECDPTLQYTGLKWVVCEKRCDAAWIKDSPEVIKSFLTSSEKRITTQIRDDIVSNQKPACCIVT